jgi:hypothetical protein
VKQMSKIRVYEYAKNTTFQVKKLSIN